MEGLARFEGKEAFGDKNQCNLFFVRNEVSNIFHLTIFLKKTIFTKITAKNNFWGITIFERMGRRTTKMNITFFYHKLGNGCFIIKQILIIFVGS